MKILVTSPSLDTNINVSGISTVVKNMKAHSEVEYVHFKVGKADDKKRGILWISEQVILPIKLIYSIKKNKIKILHLNTSLDKFSIIRDHFLLKISKRFQIPVLLHIHGGQYLKKELSSNSLKKFVTSSFSSSDLNVVLSCHEKELLLEKFHLDPDNLVALENCVPLFGRESNTPIKEKKRIIFFGRLVERKGLYIIEKALKNLSQSRDDFEFVVYGTGPDKEKFISLLQVSLENRFKYEGVANDEEKIDIFTHSDIFLLPSLFGEGMPMALLEAMSYGLVCISTDDGSIASILKNNENGFIVRKNDVDDLEKSIEYILDNFDTDHVAKIREEARQTIENNHCCFNYSNQLKKYYLEMLQ